MISNLDRMWTFPFWINLLRGSLHVGFKPW